MTPDLLLLEAVDYAADAHTVLWSREQYGKFPPRLARALESGVFFVRAGVRPFYTHALVGDRLRFDPVCMYPVDGEATYVRDWFSDAPDSTQRHAWGGQGEILIIDNAATLHGRSSVAADSQRRLRRLLLAWGDR